ncbi:Uncharacterized OsmC-related protein [Peptoclostridium litorale DSM 5388]|uniref:Putative redox protein, regulator of disulfide bond formation n=1 Tax=Peptoclostridium litorale DSM 5388 TaxID=1121324 RepID=A0A069RRA5_PEPLI|nr:OsmC family protein [Peptoclostridium litorale]KDR96707.1 putative redox protein, regulator of disulfide bond formation [Peptoclostridium litorale DSM 5388]SIN67547.1 Uncharacterized OsmC-related protein [Peptoclostridium litorale DSM 5388]
MNNIDFNTLSQTANAMSENRELAMKKWSAKINWIDGVQNQISIRDFSPFLVDEPTPLGGTDKAPNPVEYLIGSAGSCFAITFQVMASQNNIKLNDVQVEIEADLNAAVFLGLEDGNGGILKPVIKLTARTSAKEAQIKEIASIALSKSPVLLSLNPEIELVIQ